MIQPLSINNSSSINQEVLNTHTAREARGGVSSVCVDVEVSEQGKKIQAMAQQKKQGGFSWIAEHFDQVERQLIEAGAVDAQINDLPTMFTDAVEVCLEPENAGASINFAKGVIKRKVAQWKENTYTTRASASVPNAKLSHGQKLKAGVHAKCLVSGNRYNLSEATLDKRFSDEYFVWADGHEVPANTLRPCEPPAQEAC